MTDMNISYDRFRVPWVLIILAIQLTVASVIRITKGKNAKLVSQYNAVFWLLVVLELHQDSL